MKKFLMVISLFLSFSTIAQGDIEVDLGSFNEVKVFDLINVQLIKANTNRAIISGDNTSDVELVNKNGILRIRMRLGQNFVGDNTMVTLYYKHLDVIDGNEGSYVYSEELFKQYNIELRAQEGATIKVPLEVNDVKIKAVTGGNIEVIGQAVRQDISLNTGGILDGKNLRTEATYVAINAAGEALINASKLADIKIRAGGDVYIYGHPEKVNENKFLGGRIQYMD